MSIYTRQPHRDYITDQRVFFHHISNAFILWKNEGNKLTFLIANVSSENKKSLAIQQKLEKTDSNWSRDSRAYEFINVVAGAFIVQAHIFCFLVELFEKFGSGSSNSHCM